MLKVTINMKLTEISEENQEQSGFVSLIITVY